MTQDSWPSVEPPAPSGLPRVEDLPVVERGFDQEHVREAFDSFYRHLARLDSTLRALEAVDVFKSQATELRKELRALRLGGWTQQPWQPYASARASTRAGMPEAVPRLAIESIFIVAVAVGAYEAAFRPLVVAGVMALAVLIVGVVEWAAARERVALAPVPRPAAEERAEAEPEPAPMPLPPIAEEEWKAPVAVLPEPEPEALTAIAGGVPAEEPAPEHEAGAPAEEVSGSEPQAPAPAEMPVAEPEERGELVAGAPAEEASGSEPQAPPAPAEAPEVEPAAEAEPAPAPEEVEPGEEPEPESDLPPAAESNGVEPARRRWWRRGRTGGDEQAEAAPAPPRHVRVLPPEAGAHEPSHRFLDPWEEDFDLSLDEDRVSADPTPAEASESATKQP